MFVRYPTKKLLHGAPVGPGSYYDRDADMEKRAQLLEIVDKMLRKPGGEPDREKEVYPRDVRVAAESCGLKLREGAVIQWLAEFGRQGYLRVRYTSTAHTLKAYRRSSYTTVAWKTQFQF
jgi:hypothetical protein